MKNFYRLFSLLFCVSSLIAQDSKFTRIQRANRRFNSKTTRVTATNEQAQQPLAKQSINGDEAAFADKRASFGKSLAHEDTGLLNTAAFNQMVVALQRGTSDGFLNITMGTDPVQRRLVDPQGAYAFNFDGPDGWINSMPAAPALTSPQAASEMAEVYWHALARDVAFNSYPANGITLSAIGDLNTFSDFRGPKQGGVVTAQSLFRGNTPGDLVGPLISQFLYLAVPYGPAPNFDGTLATAGISFQAQVEPTPLSSDQNDFMTTFTEWLFIQRGNNPTRSITYDTTERRFIRNARDMGDYVHQDTPGQAFYNATRILLNFGDSALDPANPYLNNPTQEAFVTYGVGDILYLVSVVTEVALRAAWYQKWLVHRRLRPEYFAFLVNQQIMGVFDSGINSELIGSTAVSSIFMHNMILTTNAGTGTYFLPLAYAEGSPTHPSYPAGHATFAGACATLVKAFFNEDFVIPSPVEPNPANTALIANADTLTVGGELNKLAANISLGRDYAGVHYRSDGFDGMNLGEQIAIALLENEAWSRNINFNGFTLTKFNGETITIGAKKTAARLR